MSQSLANFVFEALNFLLLAAGLGYVLWKPARRALEAERQRYEAQQAHSEQLRQQAEGLLSEAKTAQLAAASGARDERDKLLAAAQQQADALISQARQTQESLRDAFAQEQEHARSAQVAALVDPIARLAADSLRSLLAELDGPELDTALIRGACQRLRELPQASRQQAQVESARPLSEAGRSLLEQALGAPLRARAVPELGAGVRVTTPDGQVDATALALARQAAQGVRDSAAKPSNSQDHDPSTDTEGSPGSHARAAMNDPATRAGGRSNAEPEGWIAAPAGAATRDPIRCAAPVADAKPEGDHG